MLPTAWAEAGAAPWNNIIGVDPELSDPEHGDYTPLVAVGYGCRVVPTARPVRARSTLAAGEPLHPERTRLDVGGLIDTDTDWDAALVRVTEAVTVTSGATLRIAAGARVEFTGFFGLTVLDGSLQALGTPSAPIVLTSERADEWTPDYERRAAWDGLAFLNVPAARDSSRVRWCVIECSKALPGSRRPPSRGVGGVLVPGMGGALRVVGTSHLEVSHCILRRNLAERGGAMAVHYGAAPLLINNLIHDNHALLRASGLYASYSYPRLIHCTFTANTTAAPGAFYHTGCVDHVHAKPQHIGGIYWGNDTSYYDDLQIREAKPFYTAFCDVGLLAGGIGCVDLDPQFDLFGSAPFALRADSPLIDAAQTAAAAPWLPDLDLAGGPRIAGQAPDMGAYELAATTASPPGPGPVPELVLRCAPNPFNPRTVITWSQPQAGSVTLDIHDAAGHRVRTLVAGPLAAGHQEFAWDGRDAAGRSLPAGLYLVRLRGTAGTALAKILLII